MVNVKRLKRVIQGGDPLKVLNSGDKKPAFRQNGYGLTLDAANSDYLDFDNDIVLSGDFSLSVDLVSNINGNSQKLIGYDKISLYGNGKIYFKTDTDALYLSVNGKLPYTGAFVFSIDRVGNDTFFYVDGSLVDTISGYNGDMTIQNIGSGGGSSFFDGTINNFTINSEQFNLSESRGTTTTGSEGTIATINTSNAGGVQYLDSTVWNKKAFGLEFDAANSEYLDLTTKEILIGQVFTISLRFNENSNFNVDQYLVTDPLRIFRVVFTQGLFVASGANVDSVKIDGVETAIYIGIWEDTRGSLIEITLSSNINTSGGLFVGTQLGASPFIYTSIFNLSINTEQFNLTEGLGNEVFGSNGTIGTIHTSNAQGIERTNYGQWLKGDDTNGWIPYI